MKIIKLIIKNTLRHKLRSFLTALGIAIAILAFGLLRTIIDAYFIGVEASSATRLITTNAVSLTFPLPLSYKDKILKVPGVTNVSSAFWFGGTYIDQKNFFAQICVEPESFLELYPEFVITNSEKENFLKERNSCIVGQKLARKYDWEIGKTFRLTGTIFPGDWDFVIRGIYKGRDKTTDETAMFFHYKYVDEKMQISAPGRDGQVGWFYVGVESEKDVIPVTQAIDSMFENSLAETKTETEKEFNLSFISMVNTIITSVRIISIVVIAIILLVLATTMAMTVRERVSEYAVMKTLGFRPWHLIGLIFGESTAIAIMGGILGLLITFKMVEVFGIFLSENLGGFFPIFEMSSTTTMIAMFSAFLVGLVAALFPTIHAVRMKITDGLREIA
jgi:putative ABC transport system permease protein